MKTLPIVAIVVAAALLIGGVWLYAEPQRTMTPPILGRQPLQEQAPPTSTLPLTIPAPSQTNTTSTKPVLVAFATSTHTVGMATASPAMITEGTSTPVTVTIQITDDVKGFWRGLQLQVIDGPQ